MIFVILIAGHVLASLIATICVYRNWRIRLKIKDPWGALALGFAWPLLLFALALESKEPPP